MPTYTYKCTECSHTWDEFHSINTRNDPEAEVCPNCKVGGFVYKMITVVVFGDPVKMGYQKPDQGFHDVVKKIHERTAGSRLDKNSTITKI